MKYLVLILITVILPNTYAQTSTPENSAKKMIATFFDGFHQGDIAKMQSVMSPNAMIQSAFTDNTGKAMVTTSPGQSIIDAVKNRPSDQKWEERLLEFKFSFDGNLAHVWTPYEFWVNDTFSHCGANSFTIAKTDTGWKIIHLIDSRRKKGCQQ